MTHAQLFFPVFVIKFVFVLPNTLEFNAIVLDAKAQIQQKNILV